MAGCCLWVKGWMESEQARARVESEASHRMQYAEVFGLYGKMAAARAAIAGPAMAAKEAVASRKAPARQEACTTRVGARVAGNQPVGAGRVERPEVGGSSGEGRQPGEAGD